MNGCQVSSPLDCHRRLRVKMMKLAINKKDYFIMNKLKLSNYNKRNYFMLKFRRGKKKISI